MRVIPNHADRDADVGQDQDDRNERKPLYPIDVLVLPHFTPPQDKDGGRRRRKTDTIQKDGIIEDLKVRMGDMKTKMGDMKTRMDEKDGEIEGLNEKVDGLQEQTVTLRRELKTEKNGRQDDMNALREVRRSTLISTFCHAQT